MGMSSPSTLSPQGGGILRDVAPQQQATHLMVEGLLGLANRLHGTGGIVQFSNKDNMCAATVFRAAGEKVTGYTYEANGATFDLAAASLMQKLLAKVKERYEDDGKAISVAESGLAACGLNKVT